MASTTTTTTNCLTSICVFCGSVKGNQPIYEHQAERLGELMVERGLGLVYGGSSVGLMGVVASSVHRHGGRVLGIIPHALADVNPDYLGERVLVESMHDRKQLMHEKADALIALPGGFGTMEELMETITWSQLRIHSKPVGVLNTNGYFNDLIAWMDRAEEEGFIDEHSRCIVVIRESPESLLDALASYQDPIQGPWLLKESMWKKRGHLDVSQI